MKLASDAVTFQGPAHVAGNWKAKLTTPAGSVSRACVSVKVAHVLDGGGVTVKVGTALPGPLEAGGQTRIDAVAVTRVPTFAGLWLNASPVERSAQSAEPQLVFGGTLVAISAEFAGPDVSAETYGPGTPALLMSLEAPPATNSNVLSYDTAPPPSGPLGNVSGASNLSAAGGAWLTGNA